MPEALAAADLQRIQRSLVYPSFLGGENQATARTPGLSLFGFAVYIGSMVIVTTTILSLS